MAGAELIGKEEIKEVMDVLETGILMRYGFDKESIKNKIKSLVI